MAREVAQRAASGAAAWPSRGGLLRRWFCMASFIAIGLWVPLKLDTFWTGGPRDARLRPRGRDTMRCAEGAEAGPKPGSAGAEDLAAEIAALRAENAALRREAGVPEEEVAPPAGPEAEKLREVYELAMEELADELTAVEEARMGMVADKQYVFKRQDMPKAEAIYKRKYEVLGMTITQQEAYMKAFTRTVKVAKKSETVRELIELMNKGKNNRQVDAEIRRLSSTSRVSGLFFRDILPQVKADPVQDAISGLAITLALIVMIVLLLCCLAPPVTMEE